MFRARNQSKSFARKPAYNKPGQPPYPTNVCTPTHNMKKLEFDFFEVHQCNLSFLISSLHRGRPFLEDLQLLVAMYQLKLLNMPERSLNSFVELSSRLNTSDNCSLCCLEADGAEPCRLASVPGH